LSGSHSLCGSREGFDARHGLMIQRKHNGPYIRDDHFTLQTIGQKMRDLLIKEETHGTKYHEYCESQGPEGRISEQM
jgi:hypothetical protein